MILEGRSWNENENIVLEDGVSYVPIYMREIIDIMEREESPNRYV